MASNCINEFPGDWNQSFGGLVNWSSETLPSSTLCSGSQRSKLQPGLRGSALRRSLVSHKHAALSPCTAPGPALTISHTNLTLPLGLPG